MQAPVEKRFLVGGLEIVGRAWHDPDLFPVIAVHGWLDNSASFDVLAPQLQHCHILALDLAGHGHSGHRPGLAPYNIWDDTAEIIAIADQMGWRRFGLLGHSRGGMIATLTASALPKRVKWLGLIDGLLPEPTEALKAPAQLAKSIRSVAKQMQKEMAVYPSVEAALAARMAGGTELSEDAARRIVERGVVRCEGGYRWRADQKLRAASAFRLTKELLASFLQNLQVPNTLITADRCMPEWFKTLTSMLSDYPHLNRVNLEAGHHLHMEAEAPVVAEIFNKQLQVVVEEILANNEEDVDDDDDS